MIELTDISRYDTRGFRKSLVLRHVNLAVREGEFTTTVGPSGSGKSTLLHILGVLDEASGGTYAFERPSPAVDLSRVSRGRSSRIS